MRKKQLQLKKRAKQTRNKSLKSRKKLKQLRCKMVPLLND